MVGFAPLTRRDREVLEERCGVFWLPGSRAVRVRGAEAHGFLQGLISQDVDSIPRCGWRWSFLLKPNGKADFLFRAIAPPDGGFLLDCDGGDGPDLKEALSRFLIRTDASVEEAAGAVVRVSGPMAEDVLRSAGLPAPAGDQEMAVAETDTGLLGVVVAPHPVPRPGFLEGDFRSYDVVVVEGREEDSRAYLESSLIASAEDRIEWLDSLTLEATRVLAACPRRGFELDDKTIVQETGWETVAVSFSKGCYLGQELVARIDSRGHVNRMLRHVVVPYESGEEEGGEEISPTGRGSSTPGRALEGDTFELDGKVVGIARSAAWVEGKALILLGYVRREVPPGTEIEAHVGGRKLRGVVHEAPRP